MSEMPPSSYTPPPPGGGSYTPPPPPPPPIGGGPSGPAGPASSDRQIMLVLSYLGILALIPLLMKKDDPEVQWHAKNGLVLAIALTVVWIPVIILCRIIPFLGCIAAPVMCLFPVIILVIAIMAIMKALRGERMRFPITSDIADKM